VDPVADGGDGLSKLYLLVGAGVVAQLMAAGFGIVRWLGSRTVEREDKDKEDVRAELKEHDERFEKSERAIADLDRAIINLQAEMKQTYTLAEGIRGTVIEIRTNLDNRFEKQSEFYRASLKEQSSLLDEKLGSLERVFRQDITRAMSDVQAMSAARKKRP
jgi:chromosome segregation ATPase